MLVSKRSHRREAETKIRAKPSLAHILKRKGRFPSSNSPTLARIQLPIGTTYLCTGLIECVFHHLQDVPQVMQVGHMELNPSGQEALDLKLP